jgi:hypothetical protein
MKIINPNPARQGKGFVFFKTKAARGEDASSEAEWRSVLIQPLWRIDII